MKIIHIITSLDNGGAEAVLFRLCKNDKSNKHIVISLMDKGKYGDLLLNEKIDVYTLNMVNRKISIKGIIKLFKIVKNVKPDVVHNWMYHSILIGGIVSKILGVKNIIWAIHHSNLEKKHNKFSTILIVKALSFLSNLIPKSIIFCADKSHKVHKEIGFKNKNMIVVFNGYELDKFYPDNSNTKYLKEELSLTKENNILGFVARYDKLKDHNNLLKALQLLKRKENNFKCLLIGNGMICENKNLMSLIIEYDLKQEVLLLGERSDIPDIMNLLDIHVLSSYSEAFPNVICEAMSCSTPCITTDVGDASYIVSDTGWTVPIKDPLALANAIENALLEKINDFDKFNNRKLNSRKRMIENFSIDQMLCSYRKVWSLSE